MTGGDDNGHSDGFIIEIRQVGDYVKATAIDTVTGIEATVIASPKLSKRQITDLAARKLKYVLAKRLGNHTAEDEAEFKSEGDDTIV